MRRSRFTTAPLCAAALSLCFTYAAVPAYAASRSPRTPQQPSAQPQTPSDVQRGISLYRQGKDKEAVKVLRSAVKRDDRDADAWHHLALALTRQNEVKDARKAFANAVKLRPDFAASRTGLAYALLLGNKLDEARQEAERARALDERNAEAHYVIGIVCLREDDPAAALLQAEAAISDKPAFAPAYLLKTQALIAAYGKDVSRPAKLVAADSGPFGEQQRAERTASRRRRFAEAAESLERYFRLALDATEQPFWQEQLETLRFYATPREDVPSLGVRLEDAGAANAPVAAGNGYTAKAVVLERPEPGYTEQARRAGVQGTVSLLMVLAADGAVKHVLATRGLSHGLTEKAVAAAREIKFKPAMKDGQPVSQFVTINYTFAIY